MANSKSVTLPPGFVLDEDLGGGGSSPDLNLPAGFVLESSGNEVLAPTINIPGLPGAARAESRISNRSNPWLDLASRFTQMPTMPELGNPTFPAQVAGQVIGAPSMSIESAIANPMMDMQRGNFSALAKLAMAGLPGLGNEPSSLKGFTGQRPGQFGDVLAGAGAPDPIANTGGFLAAMAIPDAVPPVQKGIQRAESALSKGMMQAAESATLPLRRDIGAISGPELNRIIDVSIQKAIRPSVVGKKSPALLQRFTNQARDAVRAIVEHKESLRMTDEFGDIREGSLPQSLNEFSQAIDQVKSKVFNEYNMLKRQAGVMGGAIELQPIVMDLLGQVNNKAVKALYPQLQRYAAEKMRGLLEAGSFSPEDAQKAIEMLNNDLKAFYRNPNPQAASNAVFDAALAAKLRLAMDEMVKGLTGKSYQRLKSMYGALRAIQDDVLHRSIVDARKNPKGFFDLGEVFATGDLVAGLLSMNPAQAVRGGVIKAVVEQFKKFNDPNRIIKNLFDTVDKSYQPMRSPAFDPGARLLEGSTALSRVPPTLEGRPAPRAIEASAMAGEGFERVMPEEAAARIGAQVRRAKEASSLPKALPAPEEFERVKPEEAYRRIREFAFKYYNPRAKQIIIPNNIEFRPRAQNLLKQMGINPFTGKIKSEPALSAFEIAWRKAKQQKAFDMGEGGFLRVGLGGEVKKASKDFPQSFGAGKIEKPVNVAQLAISSAMDEVDKMIKADPDKYPMVNGNPIVPNMDYGFSFDTRACTKGEKLTTQVKTIRNMLDDELPKWMSKDEKNAIKRAVSQKLTEAGQAQGLDVPCLICYKFEDALIGYSTPKNPERGIKAYKPGNVDVAMDVVKKNGNILRGYSKGDFSPSDIKSITTLLQDLKERGAGFGIYTKNLWMPEIFGDSGVKGNISVGANKYFGLPVDVAAKYAKRYPNFGLSYTAFNDQDLLKALKDDRVHKVIGAHLGGGTPKAWLKKVSHLYVRDYTDVQSERVKSGNKMVKIESGGFSADKVEKSKEMLKKARYNGNPKEYLKAVDEASELLGTKVEPMFAEFMDDKTGIKGGYKKLLGAGPSEYGQGPGVPKIDPSKINLKRAMEYMKQPIVDMSDDANEYARMARKIANVAKRGGPSAVEKMNPKLIAAAFAAKVVADSTLPAGQLVDSKSDKKG